MRNLLKLGLALFCSASIAGVATAEPLAYTGILTVGVGTLPSLELPFAGTVDAQVTGQHLDSFLLPATAFTLTNLTLPVDSVTIKGVIFGDIANLEGDFAISGGPPGGGPMGVSGFARICVILPTPCDGVGVTVPLQTVAGSIGLGVGGRQRAGQGGLQLTLDHAPWVIGQSGQLLTIHSADTSTTVPATTGFAHGPATGTSSTAQPGGSVQLVTVTKTFTSLLSSFPEVPVIGTITLNFVPEPGTLLLLGSGIAVLAGSRRRSR